MGQSLAVLAAALKVPLGLAVPSLASPALDLPLLPCFPCPARWVKVPAYKAVLVYESWAPEPEVMDEAVEWALAQQAAGRDVFVHCTHVR